MTELKRRQLTGGVFFEGIVSGIGGLIPGLTPPMIKALKCIKIGPQSVDYPNPPLPIFPATLLFQYRN